jgi:predicted TIM-barrel fold metal-dependent hydrolase
MKVQSLQLIFIILLFGPGSMAQSWDWNAVPEWQEAKFGAWEKPNVRPPSGPMDTILLKDYAPKSSVVAQVSLIPKARYPVIDAHSHNYARTPKEVSEWVKTMDEAAIEITVVLTAATGAKFDSLVEMYLNPYPNRFQLYCGMDMTSIDKPDYPQRATAELVRCYNKGARGVGEWIDKGSGYMGNSESDHNNSLHPDDLRLDPFWEKCAELKLPVSFHMADHPSCWKPLDVYQERSPDYQHFNRYGKDGLTYEELLAVRNRTLEKHPRTTFIACHLANQGNDLPALGKLLDMYPNLYLDISARDYEIGRMHRATLKFFTKYSGRLLFGTDLGMEKGMYQNWWRLLESEDEFMVGRMWWRYYGLGLPSPVLKSLYRENARRILNWKKL